MSKELALKFFGKQNRGFVTGVPTSIHAKIYGVCLIQCAAGDGVLHPDEKDYILGLMACFGGNDEVINYLNEYIPITNFDPVEYLDKYSNDYPVFKYAPLYLIYDALASSYADNDLVEKEEKIIKLFANKLNVTDDEYFNLKNIVLNEKELRNKKILLLSRGVNIEFL
jgi:hypothetical protein